MVDASADDAVPVKRRKRTQPRPVYTDFVCRSYDEGPVEDGKRLGKPFTFKRPTESAARALVPELRSALHYARKWILDDFGLKPYEGARLSAYVTEHYLLDGVPFQVDVTDPAVLVHRRAHASSADHWWQLSFTVHDPRDMGFRRMPPAAVQKIQEKAAEARGAGYSPPGARAASR